MYVNICVYQECTSSKYKNRLKSSPDKHIFLISLHHINDLNFIHYSQVCYILLTFSQVLTNAQ